MSAKGCPRRTTLPTAAQAYEQMKATGWVLTLLQAANGRLRDAQAAPNVRVRIRYALSSAYGAHRHATAVYLRAREATTR